MKTQMSSRAEGYLYLKEEHVQQQLANHTQPQTLDLQNHTCVIHLKAQWTVDLFHVWKKHSSSLTDSWGRITLNTSGLRSKAG